MIGEITYTRTPETWSQEEFLRLGGFTVVFLNYNKAAFIERSVASALAQDFPLCEMFFMDDASTDGSGDTMEKLVRAYSGRHKVTVVRNTVNQHITGQWNIVSRLATGNWLGMFCGDDVACVDRVSRAAESILKYPELRGWCSSAMELKPDASVLHSVSVPDGENTEMHGDLTCSQFLAAGSAFGATAWWHKSNFEKSLPKGPLDDVILHWILFCRNRGNKEVLFHWNRQVQTVGYSTSGGVSTTGTVRDETKRFTFDSKVREREYQHRINGLFWRSMQGVLAYLRENRFPENEIEQVAFIARYRRVMAAGVFGRWLVLPGYLLKAIAHRSESCGGRFIGDIMRTAIKEIFGVHLAAAIDVLQQLVLKSR